MPSQMAMELEISPRFAQLLTAPTMPPACGGSESRCGLAGAWQEATCAAAGVWHAGPCSSSNGVLPHLEQPGRQAGGQAGGWAHL